MKKTRFLIVFLVAAPISVYAAKATQLFFDQSALVFRPDKAWTQTPAVAGLPYKDVRFRASDGIGLTGWYVPAPQPRGTVLFFHGNSRNMSSEVDVLKMFRALGFDSLVFDYRGYGKSEGKPDEEGTYRDAEAAWNYLVKERKTPPDHIIIWGRSLGAAIAADLAAHHRSAAFVSEAAFTTLADLASHLHPYFPVKQLLKIHYGVINKLPFIHCPILIVHSREDELVPEEEGRRLYAAANPPKSFLEIAGPHRGLPYQEVYWKGVEKFLKGLSL